MEIPKFAQITTTVVIAATCVLEVLPASKAPVNASQWARRNLIPIGRVAAVDAQTYLRLIDNDAAGVKRNVSTVAVPENYVTVLKPRIEA